MNMNVFIPTDNETVIVHSRGTFEGQFEAVVLGDYCNGTEDLLAIDLRGLRNVLENRRREHVPFALACFFVSGEVAVTHTHTHTHTREVPLSRALTPGKRSASSIHCSTRSAAFVLIRGPTTVCERINLLRVLLMKLFGEWRD